MASVSPNELSIRRYRAARGGLRRLGAAHDAAAAAHDRPAAVAAGPGGARRRRRHGLELRAGCARAWRPPGACWRSSRARRCSRRRASVSSARHGPTSGTCARRPSPWSCPRSPTRCCSTTHTTSCVHRWLWPTSMRQVRPGARIAIAGIKYFPWWTGPLNLLAWLKNRPYNAKAG